MNGSIINHLNKIWIILLLFISIIFSFIILNKVNQLQINGNKKFDKNINYLNYESNRISNKIKKDAGWMLWNENQFYLINGIIRKYRPKNCLEVGVAGGGSSILILNAIKDIENSFLVSLDLNKQFYINSKYKTGYRVKQYFPELSTNWHLYTGEMPHKFLQKLNIKFDFTLGYSSYLTRRNFKYN